MMDHAQPPQDWLQGLEALRERIRRQHLKPDATQIDIVLAPLGLARPVEEAIRHWLHAAVHIAESRPAAAEQLLGQGLTAIAGEEHADLAATLQIDFADA